LYILVYLHNKHYPCSIEFSINYQPTTINQIGITVLHRAYRVFHSVNLYNLHHQCSNPLQEQLSTNNHQPQQPSRSCGTLQPPEGGWKQKRIRYITYPLTRGGKGSRTPDLPAPAGRSSHLRGGWKQKRIRYPAYPLTRGGKGSRTPDLPAPAGRSSHLRGGGNKKGYATLRIP